MEKTGFSSLGMESFVSEISDIAQEVQDQDGLQDESINDEQVSDEPNEDVQVGESNFSVLAEALLENGVFNHISEEDIKNVKTFDDLSELIKKEISNSEYADLNDKQRKLLDLIRSGVDENQYLSTEKSFSEIEKISDLDLQNNADLRKKIIIKDLIDQGISEKKAEKIAERSFDLGEDEDDAREALKSIKARIEKEKEKIIEEAKRQNEEKEKLIQENIKKAKKVLFEEKKPIIEGIPYNQEVSKRVFKNLTEPLRVENGKFITKISKEREKDPLMFDIKLNYIFEITNGFNDFSFLIKEGKNKAVDKLTKMLSSFNSKDDFEEDLEKFF